MTQAVINEKIKFTYSDYLVYPTNGKQLQLIEGDFYMTPAPKTKHQIITSNLEEILRKYVREHDMGIVFRAPTDVVLSNTVVVQPDILFISKARIHILTEANIQGAPDLVIEALSEGTIELDTEAKRKLYAKYGVKEYWIVDPDKKEVLVLTLSDEGFKTKGCYKETETFSSDVITGLKVDVQVVFG